MEGVAIKFHFLTNFRDFVKTAAASVHHWACWGSKSWADGFCRKYQNWRLSPMSPIHRTYSGHILIRHCIFSLLKSYKRQVFFMLTKRLHFAITFQNLDKYVLRFRQIVLRFRQIVLRFRQIVLRFRQIVLRFRQIVLVVKRAGRAWRGGEVCKQ